MEDRPNAPTAAITSLDRREPSGLTYPDGPVSKRRRLEGVTGQDESQVQVAQTYQNSTARDGSRAHFGNAYYTGTVHQHLGAAPEGPPQQSGEDPLEFLRFDQIDDRYDTIQSAYARTCRWLFERTEYKRWRDVKSIADHHGFLWIKGKPGAGKSTLMKAALQDASKRFREDVIISFFFNARGERLEGTTEGMYRSLLYQLFAKVPLLRSLVEKRKFSQSMRDSWPLQVLQDLFREAVLALGQESLTCYIDALDECNEQEMRTMVEFFEELGETIHDADEQRRSFYVCLSSRHYPNITIDRCQHLVLEDQAEHEQDIEAYVRNKFKAGGSKFRSTLKEEIQRRASGVFLWVVLVVAILNTEGDRGNVHMLRKRLDAIPDGLHDLFEDILRRGVQNNTNLVLTLQWIMYAKRPLRQEELYFAILSGVEDAGAAGVQPDDVDVEDMKRFILDSSKGLAELTKGKQPTVQFIHESVRDYLLGSGFRALDNDLEANLEGQSHERLKECCCSYLSICDLQKLFLPQILPKGNTPDSRYHRARLLQLFPFLPLCVDGILHHAEIAQSLAVPQKDFLNSFPLDRWRDAYNASERYDIRRHPVETLLQEVLTMNGYYNLLSQLDISGMGSRPCAGRHRNLMAAAVASGNVRCAEYLMPDGNAPGLSSIDFESGLQRAMTLGHVSFARLFICKGAAVTGCSRENYLFELAFNKSAISGKGWISILTRCEPGLFPIKAWRMIVRKACNDGLLEDVYKLHPMFVGHTEKHQILWFECLCAAVTSGQEELFRAICGDSSVPDRNQLLVEVLHKAASEHMIPLARGILEAGIPVNSRMTLQFCRMVEKDWTWPSNDTRVMALAKASSVGDLDMVKLLLEHGADLCESDFDYSPLYRAATARRDSDLVVQWLLPYYGALVPAKVDDSHLNSMLRHITTKVELFRTKDFEDFETDPAQTLLFLHAAQVMVSNKVSLGVPGQPMELPPFADNPLIEDWIRTSA